MHPGGGAGFKLTMTTPNRKWIGLSLFTVALICLLSIFSLATKVKSFPRRMNYEQGQVYYRMSALFLCSVVLTGMAGIALTIPVLIIFTPEHVHSITSGKNACINNLRQIDGAKEQWAHENAIEGKPDVSLSQIAPFLTNPNPKCPKGGVYAIGKIDDPPQCSIAGQTL